jgi:predicted transcriptional regulator YheO
MTFGPNIQNGMSKRNFGQCVTDEFLNLFSQNFKTSQIVNYLITLQENKIFKCK